MKNTMLMRGALSGAPLLTLLLALAGCAPDPDMEMKTERHTKAQYAPARQSQRVTVERIGVFRDDVAYNATRAIYLITDSATGREFIGVSGVGIAETGSHSSGKTTLSDER